MPQDFAQLVKSQTDIVKLIGEYVRLRKAGAQNWQGLCPFHSEKSPSFSVHAARQFFHCFGCGISGDVFTFLQRIENLPFPEAVKLAAQKAGIALPKRDFASPEEAAEHRSRGRLLELHELATQWFQQQLQTGEGAAARAYLASRGLHAEALQTFRIGYAPDSYNALRDHLSSRATAEELRASGLFSWKENEDGTQGQLYSRFRRRITFPINNESGRPIAFTARALDSSDPKAPKYLNSPETPLYSKGHVLFNLDRARQPMRQLDFALLVEGQMDCISVALAGIGNVVATSGTAFTETQARLLARYTRKLIVNFDPDTAGAAAAEKSIALLTEEGFEVRIVTLPDGLDPDRFLRDRGREAYTAQLRTARRHTDYLLDRARASFPSTAQGKVDALNYLLPHIRRFPSSLARVDFAMQAAHALGVDSAMVSEEFKQAARDRKGELPRAASAAASVSDSERILLRALAANPLSEPFGLAAEALDRQPAHFDPLPCGALLAKLRQRGAVDPLDAAQDPRDKTLLASVLFAEHTTLTAQEVKAALASLHHAALTRELRALRLAIAEAERRGDLPRTLELTRRKQALDQTLRATLA